MAEPMAGPAPTGASWRTRADWWERRVMLALVLAGLWALGGTGPALVVGGVLGWYLGRTWPD